MITLYQKSRVAHVRGKKLRPGFKICQTVSGPKKVAWHGHGVIEVIVFNYTKVGATKVFFSSLKLDAVTGNCCACELTTFSPSVVVHYYLL